ncbi:MAG: FkbM family methyltransferase [Candidatus Hodarchaeota archaeon]
MLNRIVHIIAKKYLKNLGFYLRILQNQIRIISEYPFYYLKEYLNIIKSSLLKIFREFPNIKLDYISRKINGINFNFYFSFAPRYRGMYLGLNSLPIVKLLLKYVKKKSVFLDIGANIGYLSAIGASLVGKKGETHSFEPVPCYFRKLLELKKINPKYNIFVNNFALGERSGVSNISLSKDLIGENTMISGLLSSDRIKETIQISVQRLDEYIRKKNISDISLIKIDVEGYEMLLLEGLTEYLEQNKQKLPPMVVEVTPSAYPLIGKKLGDLESFMHQYSYVALSVDEKNVIDIKKLHNLTDIVFKQMNFKKKNL